MHLGNSINLLQSCSSYVINKTLQRLIMSSTLNAHGNRRLMQSDNVKFVSQHIPLPYHPINCSSKLTSLHPQRGAKG